MFRRVSTLCAALCLLAFAGQATADPGVPLGMGEGDDAERFAYVKVAIKDDKNSISHPGFTMSFEEEGVFSLDHGKRHHEVAVTLSAAEDGKISVHGVYSVNGKLVVTGDRKIKDGAAAKIDGKGGKVHVMISVDSRGGKNGKRRDKIDGTDSDDPMG